MISSCQRGVNKSYSRTDAMNRLTLYDSSTSGVFSFSFTASVDMWRMNAGYAEV